MSVEILQISKWDDLLQTTKSLSLNSAADKLSLAALTLHFPQTLFNTETLNLAEW